MESTVWDIVVSQGVWAALFLALLVYVQRETERREKRMETTQERLLTSLEKLSDAQEKLVSDQTRLTAQHERLAEDVRVLTACVKQLCDLKELRGMGK